MVKLQGKKKKKKDEWLSHTLYSASFILNTWKFKKIISTALKYQIA